MRKDFPRWKMGRHGTSAAVHAGETHPVMLEIPSLRLLVRSLAMVLAALAASIPAANAQPRDPADRLPGEALSGFLANLAPARPVATRGVDLKTVRNLPAESVHRTRSARPQGVAMPTQATAEALVMLDPKLSPVDAKAALERHRLEVLSTEPQIGLLRVRVRDASVAQLIDTLTADPAFIAVAPNSVLTTHQLASVRAPTTRAKTRSAGSVAETVDWGIADARIDASWPASANRAYRVGVIDVGFAPHEDLDLQTKGSVDNDDHGNHVAGIICARHNGIGVKGVVPNCTTVAAVSGFTAAAADPAESKAVGIFVLVSDLLRAILVFIAENPDVKVINLSLGYNWGPNYRLNPADADYRVERDMMRMLGIMFLGVLEVARRQDIVIVSAAGNDSTDRNPPVPAKWGSPFNWAALHMSEQDGWSNGIVVEAHDSGGRRAAFSNAGGHVSAPGVDIRSLLATSRSAYGLMSGTSMAAPYVTGALTLFRALRPTLPLKEVMRCITVSSVKTESGAPKLDLAASLDACPERKADDRVAVAPQPPSTPAAPLAAAAAPAPQHQGRALYSRSHALVIGIDDYQSAWPRLFNGIRDAEEVAKALAAQGFETTVVRNPGSRALKEAIEGFVFDKGADPEARLFIWFAGHGHTIASEGYLVPADAPRPESGSAFRKAAVNLGQFGTWMREVRAKHVLAVFDSCFGGTVFKTMRSRPNASIEHAAAGPVRYFITSGAEDQTVSDDGLFRKLFLEAIGGDADLNRDGYVTGSELAMFLQYETINLTDRAQTPRHGALRELGFDRGDFLFGPLKTVPAAAGSAAVPSPDAAKTVDEFLSSPIVGEALTGKSRIGVVTVRKDRVETASTVATVRQSIGSAAVLGGGGKALVDRNLRITQFTMRASNAAGHIGREQIAEADAVAIARRELGAVLADRSLRRASESVNAAELDSGGSTELVVLDPSLIDIGKKIEPRLAWKVGFRTMTAVVDAVSGQMLFHFAIGRTATGVTDDALRSHVYRDLDDDVGFLPFGEAGAVRKAIATARAAIALRHARSSASPAPSAAGASQRSPDLFAKEVWIGGAAFDKRRPPSAVNAGRPDHIRDKVTRNDPFCVASPDYWSLCADANAGILLKSLALAADGGVHGDVTVEAIGADKLAAVIDAAVSRYFISSTDFTAAADGLVAACEEAAAANLSGLTTSDCRNVEKALKATGLRGLAMTP